MLHCDARDIHMRCFTVYLSIQVLFLDRCRPHHKQEGAQCHHTLADQQLGTVEEDLEQSEACRSSFDSQSEWRTWLCLPDTEALPGQSSSIKRAISSFVSVSLPTTGAFSLIHRGKDGDDQYLLFFTGCFRANSLTLAKHSDSDIS